MGSLTKILLFNLIFRILFEWDHQHLNQHGKDKHFSLKWKSFTKQYQKQKTISSYY